MENPLSGDGFRTIRARAQGEVADRRSRFLCVLLPAADEDEAAAAIAAVRGEHPAAAHHCTALRLRNGREKSSDGGEPAGTAGRPMLRALQARGLTGVAAVVVRYFGGTLLGAAGLVRAYGAAVHAAADAAEIVEYALTDEFRLALPYSGFDALRSALGSRGWPFNPEFGAAVTVRILVPASERAQAEGLLRRFAGAPGDLRRLGTDYLPRPAPPEDGSPG